MAINYHFDLYPADDPVNGSRLVRFTKLQAAEYRKDSGTGSIRIVINSNESEADFLDPEGLQYIRVVEENTVAVTERVVGGGFLEKGKYQALTEDGTKRITWTGAGPLAYLDRAVMAPHTYIHDVFTGQDPFDRTWNLWNQSTIFANGSYLGAMLWRVIYEAQHFRSGATYTHRHADGVEYTDSHADDRTATVIPDMTMNFDQFEDSDGTAWAVSAGEFRVSVGDRVLSVVRELMKAGIWLYMDPDTFQLSAWEVANHGRDRTGASWATDVVRLQAPDDPDDEASGNIKSASERALVPMYRRTAVWVGGGEDVYVKRTGTSPIPWEGYVPSDTVETAALNAIGDRAIAAGDGAGDAARLFFDIGDSEADGLYLPFDHIDPDDQVTVNSGASQWDWDESAYPVAAVVIRLREAGFWDAWAEVGSNYVSIESREFQDGLRQIIREPGSHTHPPNPRLCTATNLLLGLQDASLKASGATTGGEKYRACDGSVGTTWSDPNEDGVPNGYWAADLGVAKTAAVWRLQTLSASSEAATALDVYASSDAGAWAWLTDGALISGDPAANDWVKVSEYADLSFPIDTGMRTLDGEQTYRYWLFHATDGPPAGSGNDFDITEVELWTAHVGSGTDAARCHHPHTIEELLSASIDTTKRLAPDGFGGVGWVDAAAGDSDLPWIRPEDFGADPTGAAYSDDAFDDALNSATERGAALLVAGHYRFAAPLVLGNSTVIFGIGANMEEQDPGGGGALLTYRPATVFEFDNDTDGIISPDDAAVTYRCHHPVVENISIRGGGAVEGNRGVWMRDNASSSVSIQRVGLAEFRNCFYEYWGTAIDFDGTADSCKVIGGHIHACDKGFVGGQSEDTFSGVVVWDLDTGPAVSISGDRGLVMGCEIEPLVGSGIVIASGADFNRVVANDVKDITGTAISVAGANNVIVGNTASRSISTYYADTGSNNEWGHNTPAASFPSASTAITADDVRSVGRWEPVTNGVDTFVWDGDEIVVTFVETP